MLQSFSRMEHLKVKQLKPVVFESNKFVSLNEFLIKSFPNSDKSPTLNGKKPAATVKKTTCKIVSKYSLSE